MEKRNKRDIVAQTKEKIGMKAFTMPGKPRGGLFGASDIQGDFSRKLL